MKNILILACLTIATFTAHGQSHNATSSISGGLTLHQASAKGHPFLLDTWCIGNAVDLDGNLSETKTFSFDIFNNKLFFKVENSEEVLAIDNSLYSGFILKAADKDYVFKKIDGTKFSKTKKEAKFYEIAKAPSDKVIIESIKSFEDPNTSGWSTSRNTNKAGEYKLTTYIYVLDGNNQYKKVNLNESSLIKVFKEKKKEVKAFITSNQIKINTPGDLVRVVEYVHTL